MGFTAGVTTLVFVTKRFSSNDTKKKKVVVIGGGYAGRSFIKSINTDKYDVVLVDKHLKAEKQSFMFKLLNFTSGRWRAHSWPNSTYITSYVASVVPNKSLVVL